MVCLWALVNAVVFAVAEVVTIIFSRTTPCTKQSAWLFGRCVTLTDAAATELGVLLYGELLCCAAAAVAALQQPLTTRTTTTTVLAWVALVATAGIHCLELASDRIFLAADPAGNTYIFVDVVFDSICLAMDLLLAGVLFICCCSPRRLDLKV